MQFYSKIYIAGHLGLVGSALWKNLQSKGYHNLIGRSVEELDLMDTKAVNTFFAEEKPEYVILAAAKVGGIVANTIYRGQFIYENLMIQNNVIHAAYLNQVKKLLFLGSTCIYPREAPQPMPEDCLFTAPLEYTNEPYAIAKIAGIKLCESYNLQYGTNFISVMPTNLYGPNDNFDLEKSHVLPAILRKMYLGKCLEENNWDAIREDLNKRPIEGISGEFGNEEDAKMRMEESETKILAILKKYGIQVTESANPKSHPLQVSVEIWGTGAPMREFLWSEEMADACIFLMENVDFKDLITNKVNQPNNEQIAKLPLASSNDDSIREIRNTHINIGTGKEISIHDLANLIKSKVGFKGSLVFNTSKPDGTMRKLTDPSRLHALGWHHQIEIKEGVEKLYQWYLVH
ncbi:MAG TPA: GDP-L-fucose synthase [Prolixibacteraceae bacterium]|nr:GDP-L-fucose synthase [Prolixibacteraceae bacterium]